jgi:hypothetical protein
MEAAVTYCKVLSRYLREWTETKPRTAIQLVRFEAFTEDCGDYSPMWCDAVKCCRSLSTYRTILPLSSRCPGKKFEPDSYRIHGSDYEVYDQQVVTPCKNGGNTTFRGNITILMISSSSLGFLLCSLLNPEDVIDIFLRNFWLSSKYTALHQKTVFFNSHRFCDV